MNSYKKFILDLEYFILEYFGETLKELRNTPNSLKSYLRSEFSSGENSGTLRVYIYKYLYLDSMIR